MKTPTFDDQINITYELNSALEVLNECICNAKKIGMDIKINCEDVELKRQQITIPVVQLSTSIILT